MPSSPPKKLKEIQRLAAAAIRTPLGRNDRTRSHFLDGRPVCCGTELELYDVTRHDRLNPELGGDRHIGPPPTQEWCELSLGETKSVHRGHVEMP